MAIDPSISLQLRPVQMQDPIESFGRILALKHALNQQAMQPLQMQEAQEQLKARQLQNQEAGLKQHDDQVTSATFMQAGGDPAKHIQMAAAAGARPQAVQALQQHYGAIAEQAAKTDQAKLETTKYTNDQILGLTEQATQLAQSDPQKYAALWPQIFEQARKLDPGTAKHFSPDQPPTLDQLQATGLTLKTHANLIQQADEQRKQAAAQREAELQPAKVAAGNEQVAQINREAAARSNPQDPAAQQAALTADQRVTTGATAARNQATAENERAMRANAAGHLGVARAQLAVAQQNAGLDANGKPMQYDDSSISPIARQIAAYKLPAPAARSYASNRGLMNQVLAANPGFDIGQYEQRYETYKDLRPGGKLGQQALALNTLVRHSDDLLDAVKDLGNGNFVPANAGYQKLRQMFGSSAPTNFDQLKQYVAGETVKLVRGGGGTQEDEHNASAQINRANSPQQLADALKINFGVAGGKMQALNQAVRTATGEKGYTALDEGATGIMKRRGYDTETMKPAAAAGGSGGQFQVTDPRGVTHTFTDQKSANAFKAAAGIQ